LLNRGGCVIHSDAALQDVAQFAVSDKVEWLGVCRQAGFEQRTDLRKPAVSEHCVRACMDPRVQSCAVGRQPDLEHAPTLQRRAATSMQFGERFLVMRQTSMARMSFCSSAPEFSARLARRGAAICDVSAPGHARGAEPQVFAKLFRTLRYVSQPLKQRA